MAADPAPLHEARSVRVGASMLTAAVAPASACCCCAATPRASRAARGPGTFHAMQAAAAAPCTAAQRDGAAQGRSCLCIRSRRAAALLHAAAARAASTLPSGQATISVPRQQRLRHTRANRLSRQTLQRSAACVAHHPASWLPQEGRAYRHRSLHHRQRQRSAVAAPQDDSLPAKHAVRLLAAAAQARHRSDGLGVHARAASHAPLLRAGRRRPRETCCDPGREPRRSSKHCAVRSSLLLHLPCPANSSACSTFAMLTQAALGQAALAPSAWELAGSCACAASEPC
jgi:hypothetical protein